MNNAILSDHPMRGGEPGWKPGRWRLAAWTLLLSFAAVPMAVLSGQCSVVNEGGLLECLQGGTLLLASASSIVVARRLKDFRCRSCTLLLGILATLALGRELDLHIFLNPETFGPWGIHYRIDWWLNPNVSVAVKAFWVGLIALLTSLIGLLAYRSAGTIYWRCARPRLMLLTGAMYALGFTCDDLLRGVADLDIAQAVEETAEMVAAAALLGATLAPESAAAEVPQ